MYQFINVSMRNAQCNNGPYFGFTAGIKLFALQSKLSSLKIHFTQLIDNHFKLRIGALVHCYIAH